MSRTAVVHSFGAPPARLPRRVRPSTLIWGIGIFFCRFYWGHASAFIEYFFSCFLNSLRL
jgi:hypothetical protein